MTTHEDRADAPARAFATTIVQEIKAEMGRKDLSVRTVAKMAGMNHATLNNRLHRDSRSGKPVELSGLDLYRVATVLGMDVNQLVQHATQVARDTKTG